MSDRKNLPDVKTIEANYKAAAAALRHSVVMQLCAHGIEVDAVVDLNAFWAPRRSGRYRIVQIIPRFGSIKITGRKQMKDGTWGRYEHVLGEPGRLRLVPLEEIT